MVASTDREPAVDARSPSPQLANPGSEPGLVAASVYAHGKRVADVAVEEAGAWSKRPGHIVWIGLFEPSHDLLARVQAQFDLHPLAIEDAGKPHQHPKVEQYGEALFIVARTAQIVDERIAFGETHIFVGHGYVVTVRHGASSSYAKVRERVDNYMPVVETIHDEVEAIEDRVFGTVPNRTDGRRLYMLRRDLLRLRNAAAPMGNVCRRLEHAEVMAVDATMQPLFRDVTDHVHRVQEEIDMLREVLAFAFEASLMNGQAEQTSITRRLAAWAAILAVPTAIAGIYGMNFEHMPELAWTYGYFVVLGGITAICVTLYARLRHYGWL